VGIGSLPDQIFAGTSGEIERFGAMSRWVSLKPGSGEGITKAC